MLKQYFTVTDDFVSQPASKMDKNVTLLWINVMLPASQTLINHTNLFPVYDLTHMIK